MPAAPRAKVVANNNRISGYSDVGNGHDAKIMPDIETSGNIVPVGGTVFTANANQNSEQTIHDIHIRQTAGQQSSTTQQPNHHHQQTTTTYRVASNQALAVGSCTTTTSTTGFVGGIPNAQPEIHKGREYQLDHRRQQSDTVDSRYGSQKGDLNEKYKWKKYWFSSDRQSGT